MRRLLPYLVSLALLTAGLVHVFIAPEHYEHAPAHGLFFGAIGTAQVIWTVVVILRRRLDEPLLLLMGSLLSSGVILIWVLAHYVQPPFAASAHENTWATLITKTGEAVAFLLLLYAGISAQPRRLASTVTLTAGLLAGTLVWGAGLAATPLLPALAEPATHTHDDGTDHTHDVPHPITRSTSAYFTIVNTDSIPDTLISVTSNDLDDITLHETTIGADAVARMDALAGVELAPHVRTEFAPGARHVMIDGFPRDLYDGDHLVLTLHFASGRSLNVDFAVTMDMPSERINFIAQDSFQVTNAWVRATASLDQLVVVNEGGYVWQLPAGFPPPRVPPNNPMTAEKVELGRYLFYDQRLSGNATQSCASCHIQALAFTDGRPLAVGSTGETTPRNSMSLTNAAYNATLTWANPNLLILERQIPIPMFGEHPIELGITGHEEEVLDRLRQDARYRGLFASAYPDQEDPFSFNNVTMALASFTRSLISGNSAYDRYLQGDVDALNESARRGMDMFFSERFECHHCHTGFNFTLSTVTASSTFDDFPFFNTGLYNVAGTGAYPDGNTGIHEITNAATDMGRFRPPTLRNIALTAPYMHDGSVATLRDVLQIYMDGGRQIVDGDYAGDGRANPYKSGLVPGFTLTDGEIVDLLAFLNSLTDETFISDPRFSDPFLGSQQ